MDSIMCVYEHTLAFISHHCHRFIDRMMKENSPPELYGFMFSSSQLHYICHHVSQCVRQKQGFLIVESTWIKANRILICAHFNMTLVIFRKLSSLVISDHS